MSNTSLKDLNALRTSNYQKDSTEEQFLLDLNRFLMAWERSQYENLPEEHTFLFVFGLPRSGTTLLAQVIAHSFDVGYINNFMARFWLAPVTGVRLAHAILGGEGQTNFQSHYATTCRLTDIHEFGYFWRYWLRKETVSQIVQAEEEEASIDWRGLKKTLLNLQHEFDKPMVFKNIFGAYHIRRFVDLLSRALFVYIERDPLDVAISMLDARRAFYGNPDTWWSTYPPEYDVLRDQPYMEQIAGQVHYLRRFYNRQMKALHGDNVVRITYRDLCSSPTDALEAIHRACMSFCNYDLEIATAPPSQFEYRQHEEREAERNAFKAIFEDLAAR